MGTDMVRYAAQLLGFYTPIDEMEEDKEDEDNERIYA